MIGTLAIALQVAAGLPEVVQRARVNPAQGVNFAAAIVPETVAVGQQAVYQVAVFVSDEVRQRLRRNPEFVPPELRAVLAYDPPGGYTRYPNVRIGGRDWEAHVFQRVVFPLAKGRVDVPPARLSYALPLSSSFFSREETYTVRSPAVTLVAVDPPEAGRPADWDGAVGQLQLRARVEPRQARVGDPVTVTLRVTGAGNINLLPRPRLDIPWGDAVPAGERVTLDSVRLRVVGAKEFEWVVTPNTAGRQTLPPQRYPVFDPTSRRYEIVQSSPEELEIAAGAAGAGGTGVPPAGIGADDGRLPVRRTWTGERPDGPWTRWPFWLMAAVAPGPALWRWRRARRRPAPTAVGGRPLPSGTGGAAGDAAKSPADRYEQWLMRVRRLVPVPVGTDVAGLRQALRRAGVTDATAARAVALDDRLAQLAYGPVRRRPDAAATVALVAEIAAVEAAIAAELGRRATGRAGRGLAWGLLLAGAATGAVTAATGDAARARFEAGVAAYEAGQFVAAQRDFADAARLAPRAPDAWANLGTAAYAVADTGVAAMGWQRALRLDPRADDVRTRLEAMPGMRAPLIAPATVWPVGAEWLAILALASWAVAWATAALGGAVARPFTLGLLLAAVSAAAAAAAAEQRARGDGLFVVAQSDRLRVLPALGADPVAAVSAGELVTGGEGRDGWRRVRLDDGRDGWLEERLLLGLARVRRGASRPSS
ncbi:MAG: SH3 domain-containing protein [Gemmatimonadota bacterium]|nr:hypothetical protein [Gemmatimonadota bacterium]